MTKTINSTSPSSLFDRITAEQKAGWRVRRVWYERREVRFLFFLRLVVVYFAQLVLPDPKLVFTIGPVSEVPIPDQEVKNVTRTY